MLKLVELIEKNVSIDDIKSMILSEGNNINSTDKDGNTLLHLAIVNNNYKLVKFLIEKNATIAVFNKEGIFPLEMAIIYQRTSIVKYLVKHNSSLFNKNGFTPLHCAAAVGNTSILKLIMPFYKGFNSPEQQTGYTALHYACQDGHFKASKMLLYAGAKADVLDGEGFSPLHIAAALGNKLLLELLLKFGARINRRTPQGTPLHAAVAWRHYSIVKRLLELKANINIKDNEGRTPLQYAYYYNNKRLIKLILDPPSSR